MLLECREQVFDLPGENASVPEKISARDEGLCQFDVWLLSKGLHFVDSGSGLSEIVLDVTVTSVGMSWFNANSHKRVDVSNKVQSLSCGLNKLIGIENEIVRWGRNHQRIRVLLVKLECDVCYTWRGILLRRFGNDVFSGKVRKLFLHYFNILKRSDDEDVFRRHHLAVAIEGLLNECLTGIEY